MKRIFIAIISLALLAPLVPATAASKAQNTWATTHKIVYVGLTPKDQPNFWTENPVDTTTATSDGEMLSFAKESVANAISFWKQNSRGKMKFATSKFIIGKAGTAIAHCNGSADIKTAMKIAGLKTIPIGTHLVSVNIYDTCGYAGLGAFTGNSVNLRALGSTTFAHELGHNFGYYHSSSIYCGKSDYTKFNKANCSLDEYGDFRDLMGNEDWCPNATLSATQRATIFHTPLSKAIKIGADTTVDESKMATDNIVYEFNYKGIWYFFEYYIPGKESCSHVSSFLYKPQIQIRMIGPSWTTAQGSTIGPTLVVRSDSDLPASVVNLDPEALPQDWTLTGFLEGEKFRLPGAPYMLTVKSLGATSAVITLTKV